jgi:SAM-dependent methyltransferase
MSEYTDLSGRYTDPLAYDQRSGSPLQTYIQPVWQKKLHALIDALANKPSSTVCDLGCGTLEFARFLDRVSVVYAVDTNREMITAGRKKVAGLKTRFRYLVEDSVRTSVPAASCQAVLCIGLIEFVDLANLWQEIGRITRPGATVIFSLPNPSSPLVMAEHLYQKFIRRKFVKNLYRLDRILAEASRNGFEMQVMDNLGAVYWVPRRLEKYFAWTWPVLERLNARVKNLFPFGAYTYLVLVKQKG